ncbi:MAG TPA: hypothetical protein VMZ53_00710 [Kofleriaceae bacterium]|nr:hypothetical protein [Kofleriaceae bacterium]
MKAVIATGARRQSFRHAVSFGGAAGGRVVFGATGQEETADNENDDQPNALTHPETITD